MSKLFNDAVYDQARKHVQDGITLHEFMLYMSGKIKKLYYRFDHLLLDSVQYYNRILRTVIFVYDNIIINNQIEINADKHIRTTSWNEKITPTTLYYLCMIKEDSSEHEIELGYPNIRRVFAGNPYTFNQAFEYLIDHSVFYMTLAISCENASTKKYSRAFSQDTTDVKYINTALGMKNHFVMIRSEDINNAINVQIKSAIEEQEFLRSLKASNYIWIEQISESTILFKTFDTVYKCTLNSAGFLEKVPINTKNPKFIEEIESFVFKKQTDIINYIKQSRKLKGSGKELFASMIQQYIEHNNKGFKAVKSYDNFIIEFSVSKNWNWYELYSKVMIDHDKYTSENMIARGSIQNISYILSWMNVIAVGYDLQELETVAVSRNLKHALHLHYRFKISSNSYESILADMELELYEKVKNYKIELEKSIKSV